MKNHIQMIAFVMANLLVSLFFWNSRFQAVFGREEKKIS
jgi:hypothetical protein